MNDRLIKNLKTFSPFVIAGITVGLLALSWQTLSPNIDYSGYTLEILLACFLTLFTIYFGILLADGELSASHIVGIAMFLAFPAPMFPALTITLAIGAVLGGLALQFRGRIHPLTQNRISTPASFVLLVARVTIPFWVAGHTYLLLGGRLPINTVIADTANMLISLTLYALIYIVVYLLIYLLECVYTSTRVAPKDFSRILIIVILPSPFAILGAEVLNLLDAPAQIIFIAGLMFIIFALHALSLSEFQVRKQLNEVQTLSVITQTMRSHLELSALLRTIYVQVAHLLEIDNFVAALHDAEANKLVTALVMRRGHEEARLANQPVEIEHSLVGYVYSRGEPLLIADDALNQILALNLTVPDSSVSAWLGVPLQVAGKVSGVLAVMSTDPERIFTQNDRRLLTIVAASSSIAIENAQLYKQQTERTEQLSTLNRISALLSGSLSPENTFDSIISSASMLSRAHAVALYLSDEGGFSLTRSGGLSDDFIHNPPLPLFLNVNMPMTAILVEDININERYPERKEIALREGKAAFIEMPLLLGQEMLGIVTLYYNHPQVFSGENIELLKTFTNQAAQAILNARQYTQTSAAYQKTSGRLDALLEIGRSLASTIELKQVYELVLGHALSATHVNRGVVAVRDEITDQLQIATSQGYSADQLIRLTNSINTDAVKQHVIREGEVLHIEDVSRLNLELWQLQLHEQTASMLVVPIRRGEMVRGVITLASDHVHGFNGEDIHFVEQLANQAVIAIDNSRLFSRISQDRDRLQVLLDAMEEGIMLIDQHGFVVLANPRLDLVGLHPSAILGHNLLKLSETDANLFSNAGFENIDDIQTLVKAMDTTRVYPPVMYSVHGTKGELYIRRQILPVKSETEEIFGLLVVFYNKTEEQELARSRDEFSRMIVHDLRSPLTAVTTSLKFLTEFIPRESEYYKLVETMTDTSRRAIKKLLRRVDSLLDIAKMESGQIDLEKDMTDLQSIVDNVFRDLEPLTQEILIELKSEIPQDYPPMYIDSDKVERLLMNLVDNATKYAPQETRITVRISQNSDPRVGDGYARIDVIDQGPGVPDEYKDRLFDRFVQIQGRQKIRRGVGLGLAFCRMVVAAHGGSIWIEDNPTGGSIFSFTLPIANLNSSEDDD